MLQFVGDDLWSPGENDITIVHTWRFKGVDECRRRLRSEHQPNMSKQVALTLVTCFSRLRSAETTTPSTRTCYFGVITSTASCREWKVKSCNERLVPAQSTSVLSMFSFSRWPDIHWLMSRIQCSSLTTVDAVSSVKDSGLRLTVVFGLFWLLVWVLDAKTLVGKRPIKLLW